MKQLGAFLLRLKQELKTTFTFGRTFPILLGTAIISFGITNIHSRVGISEGGVLGLLLLCNFWLGISSSILSPLLDGLSYLLGFKYLGKEFLKTSIFASISLSFFYRIWESIGPVLPDLSSYPLAASVAGALLIGTGCGLVVRQGASSGGDDALALVISKLTKWKISRAYLFTDVTVLVLSLSYIPLTKIVYSLITVTISSFMIDFVSSWGKETAEEEASRKQSRRTSGRALRPDSSSSQ